MPTSAPIRPAPLSPFPSGPDLFPIPVVDGPPKVSHRWRNLGIAAIVVAAILIIGFLAISSLTTPFSLQVATSGCGSHGSVIVFPPGSTVTFHWNTPAGSGATVMVYDLSQSPIYTGGGDSGSGFFTSNGGSYSFNATACSPMTVSFAGDYTLGTGFL